jgi:hypothetical protein
MGAPRKNRQNALTALHFLPLHTVTPPWIFSRSRIVFLFVQLGSSHLGCGCPHANCKDPPDFYCSSPGGSSMTTHSGSCTSYKKIPASRPHICPFLRPNSEPDYYTDKHKAHAPDPIATTRPIIGPRSHPLPPSIKPRHNVE